MMLTENPCALIEQRLKELWAEWEDAERVYHYDPEMSGYYDLLQRQIEDAGQALADCQRRNKAVK